MKTKILFLILILFSNLFYSQDKIQQQKSIDSLIAIVADKNAIVNKGTKEMLRLCTEIYYQSKSIDYNNGILSSIYGMGGIYADEQNYEEALKRIPEGLTLAEESKDYKWWAKLLMIEGVIYSNLGYSKRSREALDKSLYIVNNFSVKDDRHFIVSTIYESIAINFSTAPKANNDSMVFYLHKAYVESKKIEKKYIYRNLRVATFALNLGSIYVERNDIGKAEKFINEFELIMKNEKDKSFFIQFYNLKGLIENKKKNYTEAIEYFKKSLQLIHEYKLFSRELKDVYKGMAESYLGLNDFKNQALYLSKVQNITDSISTAEKKILNNAISTQNKSIKETKSSKNYNYIIAVVLVLIAASILYIFVERQKTKGKASKNNELPVADEKSYFSDETSQQGKEKPEKEVQILRELIELVQSKDKSFHLKFSEAFPEFDHKLLQINPALTHSDLEYCALMKLKFETKEIAQYKNVTINSVESKKYRLRKKLNIPTNIDIYTWMLKVI
jgi:tetratricopeptide (TPR) repeat protein